MRLRGSQGISEDHKGAFRESQVILGSHRALHEVSRFPKAFQGVSGTFLELSGAFYRSQ